MKIFPVLAAAAAFSLGGCETIRDTPRVELLASANELPAEGWITAPGLAASDIPVVLLFRNELQLAAVPKQFDVEVTADNRFILYVNDQRVASGPSTGDVDHWRVEKLDLAPYLRSGHNVIAAAVWNGVKPVKIAPDATAKERSAAASSQLFTQTAPLFQQSVATGFRLIGTGASAPISTGQPGWRVMRDPGHGFINGWAQVKRYYYVAGAAEKIDAGQSPADWTGAAEKAGTWADAVPAPEASERSLVADRLPQQLHLRADPGRVVRADPSSTGTFPLGPVTIPANSTRKLLIDRGAMIAAYPELSVAGGKGATIEVTYSEALYDEKGNKGDRDLVGDRKILGLTDSLILDGTRRTLGPLWWRTWRYMEIAVKTADQPLTLEGLAVFETGFPFEQVASFRSDDPELERIFDIGWRTARVGAHETYMDTPYWEQLQYIGDTRLQMLISYAVSGDPRLAENAIDLLGASHGTDGLLEGAYPTRGTNMIATFTPLWIGMLDDWRMRQPDPAPVLRNLPQMREALGWVDQWIAPSGLLRKNPEWNFVDWAGQGATDRDEFPSYSSSSGESCLTTILWLGALQQGAKIEAQFGDPAQGKAYAGTAQRMRDGIRTRCWNEARGLYSDNPDQDAYSQHMNALAVLYDVAEPAQARTILNRIVAPGRGIDAPEGMREVSYYFAWYLIHAFEHAGHPDRYFDLLKTWRDLLALNYTTWPEERGKTRSDTHAWSAHPTADLLGIVAGVGPGAPGYAAIRIAPTLGSLRAVEATVATPHGPVRVHYRREGGRLTADIQTPSGAPADFVWEGVIHRLRDGANHLKMSDTLATGQDSAP